LVFVFVIFLAHVHGSVVGAAHLAAQAPVRGTLVIAPTVARADRKISIPPISLPWSARAAPTAITPFR
jgi:hypothetical protein